MNTIALVGNTIALILYTMATNGNRNAARLYPMADVGNTMTTILYTMASIVHRNTTTGNRNAARLYTMAVVGNTMAANGNRMIAHWCRPTPKYDGSVSGKSRCELCASGPPARCTEQQFLNT